MFICGEMEVIVPWRIVPGCLVSCVRYWAGFRVYVGLGWSDGRTILKLDCHRFVGAFHEEADGEEC